MSLQKPGRPILGSSTAGEDFYYNDHDRCCVGCAYGAVPSPVLSPVTQVAPLLFTATSQAEATTFSLYQGRASPWARGHTHHKAGVPPQVVRATSAHPASGFNELGQKCLTSSNGNGWNGQNQGPLPTR